MENSTLSAISPHILTKIEGIVIEALTQASIMHATLGAEHGLKIGEPNRFGEPALEVDICCEGAILTYLGRCGIAIRVNSEEHGLVNIGDSHPRFFGVLDGLDGSTMAKTGWNTNRYGTMFGIFDGHNPAYDDYLVSGYMEHATRRLYLAVKGKGACVIENSTRTPIKTSGKKAMGTDTRIYVDEYFDFNVKYFSDRLREFSPNAGDFYAGTSAAVAFASVASGAADFYLRSTVKANLEPAVAYAFMAELGGVMVDENGNSFGPKKYLEYGQGVDMLPIITAATPELASELIWRLKNK